jgi:hypothetical protein
LIISSTFFLTGASACRRVFSCSFFRKKNQKIVAVEILPGIPGKNRTKTNEVASTLTVSLTEWFS